MRVFAVTRGGGGSGTRPPHAGTEATGALANKPLSSSRSHLSSLVSCVSCCAGSRRLSFSS